jgi:4-azaleucine resistance transporter AzlC
VTSDERARLRAGVRAGFPFALAGSILALSFGVVATQAGVPRLAALAMSLVVFAGSAQFASVGILASGGGLGAAVAAAALVNSRFLPMGFALAPSLRGGRVRRALEGQAVVDSSWAMASRGDGTYDRSFLFGHTGVQYVAWQLGTLVGVLLGGLDERALGLDAVFPAFFLALLVTELRAPARRLPALVGALVALALVPVAPVGVPVLAASAGALLGVRR